MIKHSLTILFDTYICIWQAEIDVVGFQVLKEVTNHFWLGSSSFWQFSLQIIQKKGNSN